MELSALAAEFVKKRVKASEFPNIWIVFLTVPVFLYASTKGFYKKTSIDCFAFPGNN